MVSHNLLPSPTLMVSFLGSPVCISCLTPGYHLGTRYLPFLRGSLRLKVKGQPCEEAGLTQRFPELKQSNSPGPWPQGPAQWGFVLRDLRLSVYHDVIRCGHHVGGVDPHHGDCEVGARAPSAAWPQARPAAPATPKVRKDALWGPTRCQPVGGRRQLGRRRRRSSSLPAAPSNSCGTSGQSLSAFWSLSLPSAKLWAQTGIVNISTSSEIHSRLLF